MVKTRLALCAMVALAGAACTVNSTDIPPLSGPSEFARSFRITANPDTITHDGASQSTITVTARNENSEAISGQQIRLDILVDGVPTSYGSLSSKTIVTASDGRATSFYTAPPAPPFGSAVGGCGARYLPGPCVTIAATLIGATGFTQGSFGWNTQVVDIHLLPLTVIPNPDAPVASFTFFPTAPTVGQRVIFNSTSLAAPGRTLISFDWNWGDGETADGMVEDHDYPVAGTYIVTLIVTDDIGQKGAVARVVSVTAGAAPPTTP